MSKNKNKAQLDLDRIQFPLKLRNYKVGEKFTPLGMKNKKKISDFLSNLKVGYLSKLKQCVIADKNNNILWVVGRQISENFKVDSNTKNIIEFEII